MKAKIGVLVLAMISFSFYFVVQETKQAEAFEKSIRAVLKDSRAEGFYLKDITDFDWTSIVVIQNGCKGECLDEILGFQWNRIGRDGGQGIPDRALGRDERFDGAFRSCHP